MSSSLSKGIACLLASSFFFALMNVFVRLSGDLPSSEKALFRNLIAFLIALIMLVKESRSERYQSKKEAVSRKEIASEIKGHLSDLIKRSLFGTIGILGNFYAVDHLLLADASAIQKLVPFVTLIASALILKEALKSWQLGCVAGAFLSTLLVVKPSLSFMDNIASLAAAGGAIGAGIAYVYVRKLSLAGVRRSLIICFFSGFSILVLLPFLFFEAKMPSLEQTGLLLMAGLMAAGGQYGVTYAYSFAPASQISIFDYSQIVFSALLGFFFFGQIPDRLSIFGYILIVFFAMINFVLSRRHLKST